MTTEGRGGGDPFADPEDPQAAAREERRREREERRRERATAEASAQPPSPPPEPPPPGPPRTADEEFWDEEPPPRDVPPPPDVPMPPELSPPPPPREPPPTARRGRYGDGAGRVGGPRRSRLRLVAAVAAVAVAIGFAWFLWALFQPFHGAGSGRVVVTIPKGASASEVGDILDEAGVVSSSALFQIRVTLAGKRSNLYAGRFVLAHDMSYGSAIDALSHPPAKVAATVTIPEGYTRRQAAPLVEEDGLRGSYLDETVRSKYLDPAAYGGRQAKNLEGFLFPDTFELKPHASVADLVRLQVEDFKRRIKGVDMRYARSKNLTVYEVLTIASMVQAESGVVGQDRLVAAVIYNRLHEGMPLGIDATTRFATGNYDRPLTESELAVESPYNTRTHAGLPPGPIGNPGLDAIRAAANPAKVDYLFYVTKPGGCNELTFAKTEAKFQEDVARYEAARERAGGRSPTSCGE